MDLYARVFEVLERGYVMHLGTESANGPRVVPLIYVHDKDFKLYWISSRSAEHSKAILASPRVGGDITISTNHAAQDLALCFTGVAKQVNDVANETQENYWLKLGKEVRKLNEGASWYRLRLLQLSLTDGRNFGPDKQIVF